MSHQACLNGDAAPADSAASGGAPVLVEVVGALQSVAEEHEDTAVLQGCADLSSKLASRELNLVVVGQFKRGKTSFLNALMGAPLLPVAVLPLTSVVTVLRYGDSPRGLVHFENGKSRSIGLESLHEFVTEAGNPKNRKGVSRVEVFYPSPYLEHNARLIDTPGIGSVYEHNTQVTYGFVPRIDAAILVTSPDPPLTSAELELLSSITGEVEKVFLVVNKTDLVDEPQLHEVIGFLRRNLPAAVAGAPILPVSSRLALQARQTGDMALLRESGFPELETAIRRFLRDEKDEVFQRAVRRRLLGLISELRIRLTLETEAARTPVAELERSLEELNRQLVIALRQAEESEFLMRGHTARLCAEADAAVKAFAERQVETLQDFISRRFDELRTLPRKKLAEQLDKDLRREIESRFDAWLKEFEQTMVERLRELAGRFEETVNELIRGVRRTAGTLFGVELHGFDAVVELVMVRGEGYYTDSLITWGLGSLPLLLPRPWYEAYLRARVLRQAQAELDRNAARRAYDLRRRLERSASLFRQELKEKLNQTVDRIRGAIHAAIALQASGEAEAERAISRLRASTARLDELERMLRMGGIESPPVEAGPAREPSHE